MRAYVKLGRAYQKFLPYAQKRYVTRTGIMFLVVLAFVTLAVGCASKRKISKMSPGEEQVVDRIPDRAPAWLNVPFEETKQRYFFKGEAARAHEGALGMRQARANGIQSLVEAIKIKARSEFSEAVRGVNVSDQALGRYLDNVVAWTSENVQVSGIVPEGEYREKVQVRTYDGVKYYYNCYTRLSIPIENYLRAREAALTRSVAEAQDSEAKALAHEAKEKLSR